jgi:hypothetical protein
MTLPNERTRAVQNVEVFLIKLCDPKLTPRIPREIRWEARWLLKHYPGILDLTKASHAVPDYWGMPIDRSAWERFLELRAHHEKLAKKKPRRKKAA